ncbi:basic region leucine zipper [Oesophagostomum dentatum]|uniref:Basic region leucine zipper n=1 Tax=Oesophagostomum dentatum TaxID=61180 RepID=A0A0B1SBF5_OESDE|nr:basic region leucine zipper [Oesophagostomum dentatum]
MLPAFGASAFDPQPFAYNPYGYSVPFPTYGAPPPMPAAVQPCATSPFYSDSTCSKSSTPACSKSESDISSDEAYRKRREKRDRNNEAARNSRIRRKAREGRVAKEAEVLQKENQMLKDEVGELKKVFYTLQEELTARRNTDAGNVENIALYQNIEFSYNAQLL